MAMKKRPPERPADAKEDVPKGLAVMNYATTSSLVPMP